MVRTCPSPYSLRFGNSQIFTDLSAKILINFPMPWNRRYFLLCSVHLNGMIPTLPKKLATVFFTMSDQIYPFHTEIVPKASLIVSLPEISSSASCRFASRTS